MSTLFGKDRVQYSGQVRKYTSLFGSLFSEMHILRKSSELKSDLVHVPIRYGPGDLRNKADLTNSDVRTGLVLPAMAFELQSLKKDVSRMTSQYQQIRKGSPIPGNFNEKFAKAPVPYDINYRLTLRSRNVEDMLMILEQIVSVFNPQVSVHVIDNNSMEVERDVTIRLMSDDYDFIDNYQHSMEENRIIEVSLDFVVKGYMYKYEEVKPVLLGIKYDPATGDYGSFGNTGTGQEEYTQTAVGNNVGNLISSATQ